MSTVEHLTNQDKLCSTCGEYPFKYRCPACSRTSCCLVCVKQHKVENKCSGVRSKTAFLSLNQFTDNKLLSDYYFLNDVGRYADSAHRDRIWREKDHSDSKARGRKFNWLRSQATRRGTTLQVLSQGMTLHKTNTSRTVRSKQSTEWEIVWRVHLVFPQCDLQFHEDSVSECTCLYELLNKYIHPTQSDPVLRHRLRKYVRSGGVDGCEVFMKIERNCVKQRASYYHLDMNSSLCDNLRNKMIIEFPTLHIVLKEQCSEFMSTEPSRKQLPVVSHVMVSGPTIESNLLPDISKTVGINSTPFENSTPCGISVKDQIRGTSSEVTSCSVQQVEDCCGGQLMEHNSSLQLIAQMYSYNEESD